MLDLGARPTGGYWRTDPSGEKEEWVSEYKFAESVGARSIEELRKKPAEEILKAPRPGMELIVDGWALPKDVYSTFSEGKQNDVPVIVCTVADDAPGPAPGLTKAADVPADAQKTYGDLADQYLKGISSEYG